MKPTRTGTKATKGGWAIPATCECGAQPEIVMVTEWPAQYRVKCACGKTALGCYYASDDKEYRHATAKKSAMEEWNKKQRRMS